MTPSEQIILASIAHALAKHAQYRGKSEAAAIACDFTDILRGRGQANMVNEFFSMYEQAKKNLTPTPGEWK